MAGRQQITRDWFETAASAFDMYVSQFVVREVGTGDPVAARARLALVEGGPLLAVTRNVINFATTLQESGAVPANAEEDAFHIAVAAVHGIDYLLTWNFRHIANAAARQLIDESCRGAGLAPIIICTPEELMDA
ncbi:MAG: type II toxin-antitoxin system VapC family toxin [Candidatus Hydrogenedentota bacterium]